MAETSNAEFIKRKRDAIADITNYDSIADLVVKDLLDAFTRLEQADKKIEQQRWIPVSERLPEEENHPDAIGHSKSILCYNPDLKACRKAGIGGRLWVDIYNTYYGTWLYGLEPTHFKLIISPDDD